MQKQLWVFVLGLLTVLAVSGCDSGTAPTATPVAPATPTPVAPAAGTGATNLQDAVAMAGVRAHLLAADALSKAGQQAAALKHVQIIQGELVPALLGSATARAMAGGLSETVGLYAGLLEGRTQADATALSAAHTAALTAADNGIIALGGPALDTAAGRAALVHELLLKTEHEYEEALAGGSAIDREPYETAYGYFQVASEQYRDLQGILKATQPANQPDLDEHFEQLALALPSITAPATPPVPPSAVEEHVDAINATLANYSGAAAAPADYPALIAATRAEVAKALTQYAGGDADAAYETAAGAYLNHFEALEGPLGKQDQALVGELEGQFKDLRDGIKAGQAQAGLQAIADQINAGLDKAQQLLSGSN
jgi:hypothetical protein